MSGDLNTATCVDPGCSDPGCGGFVDKGASVVSALVTAHDFDAGAYAVAGAVSGDGATAAVALGDETVRLLRLGGAPAAIADVALPGMPLDLAADVYGAGFLVGCDDGSLLALAPDGTLDTLSRFGESWVERIAVSQTARRRAASVGKTVHVLDAAGGLFGAFTAPAGTVTGLAFSPDGTRIAAAHYNGVTAWSLTGEDAPLTFEWKGAHTAVTWSPDGRFLVSATQENELHAWDLETGTDMRMSGYPSKVRALAFTADGAYLAAAGADTVTSWPFEGGGPKGKAPLELGYVFDGVVTQVACHPAARRVAAGYSDGTVLVGDIVKGDAITAKATGGGPVTALAWTADGDAVLAGTEDGDVRLLDIAAE